MTAHRVIASIRRATVRVHYAAKEQVSPGKTPNLTKWKTIKKFKLVVTHNLKNGLQRGRRRRRRSVILINRVARKKSFYSLAVVESRRHAHSPTAVQYSTVRRHCSSLDNRIDVLLCCCCVETVSARVATNIDDSAVTSSEEYEDEDLHCNDIPG